MSEIVLDRKTFGALAEETRVKILRSLLERQKTQSELAKEMGLAVSTVAEHLEKLREAGLVRGKKDKHKWVYFSLTERGERIASPGKNTGVFVLSLFVALVVFVGGVMYWSSLGAVEKPVEYQTTGGELKVFASQAALAAFLKENAGYPSYGGFEGGFTGGAAQPWMPSATTSAGAEDASKVQGGSEDYSTTNIQVAGVDEADFVKNDGKYIYIVSGRTVSIVDAYPASGARMLSNISFDGQPSQIFINEDKLVVMGRSADYSHSFVFVYDVSDRAQPKLLQNFSVEGQYYDSRMMDGFVYVIVENPIYLDYYKYGPSYSSGLEKSVEKVALPNVSENGVTRPAGEWGQSVYYFDYPDDSYQFTTIASVDLNKQAKCNNKDAETTVSECKNNGLETSVFLTGRTQTLYVSQKNIYLTHSKHISTRQLLDLYFDKVFEPLLPEPFTGMMKKIRNSDAYFYEKTRTAFELLANYSNSLADAEKQVFLTKLQEKMSDFQQVIANESEKTAITRLRAENGRVLYGAQGEVSGRVLNQFSMDEYEAHFRIATTTGSQWAFRPGGGTENTLQNHIFVLNNDLKVVGKLDDLGKGETIHSARFLGARAYLVTFKKTDPLFVIDLRNPTDPRVLGELKMPGYSDYLHPYDETHLIGIGKNAVGAEEGDFAWYQGVKLAIFDVSDVANPREMWNVSVGDRGTDSYALYDHKAFLFSKEKNLLVVPILLAEINRSDYPESRYPGGVPPYAYGDAVWQGAYVFDLSLEGGFALKGRVSHENETELGSYRYYYSPDSVKRSLYIGGVLYTVSEAMIKANDLQTLAEISEVSLPGAGERYYGPVY